MLPANTYPEFKKYLHLVGNFGGVWQNQQKEFDGILGCILMIPNILQVLIDKFEINTISTPDEDLKVILG